MSKIILVTGANQGIGYEIVRQLAQKGHTVYLGARNEARGKEAEAKLHAENLTTVHFLQLDVTSQASVDEAFKKFNSQHSHLDVLVNNAGVNLEFSEGGGANMDFLINSPSNINIDLMKQVHEVNFYGAIRVTNAFLPLVKKSSFPVILNVSSGLGSLSLLSDPSFPYYKIQIPGYNTSKSALNMYTVGLAAVLPEVKVNVINPGLVATNLNNYQGILTPSTAAEGVIKFGILLEKDGPHSKLLNYDGTIIPW